MDMMSGDHVIRDEATLTALYGAASPGSIAKEVDHVHPHYAMMIAASPFMVLATSGPGGMDASPRGDAPGFVTVEDERTLLIPDRRGNNRIDSLRNLVRDPRIALLFLIPGVGETMRIIGRAKISTDPKLTETFVVNGKVPKCVLVVTVAKAYFQCTKAIIRSKLWDPAQHVERKTLPTPGAILAELTDGKMGGPEHDRLAPERIKATIY